MASDIIGRWKASA